ncbi:MAG: L,D-transpeptidase, partial [Alphaproteobacteria bacterium]
MHARRVARRGVLAGAAAAALALPAEAQRETASSDLRGALPVHLIVVEKGRRRLQLYYRDRAMRSYRVALGQN